MRSPIGSKMRTGNSPDFFRVVLEKGFIEACAKPVGDPVFEGSFFAWTHVLPDLRKAISADHQAAFRQAKPAHDIEGCEGIIEEAVVVENARQPFNEYDVFGENVEIELMNLAVLCIETVRADIEQAALMFKCAGQAANLVRSFKNHG